MTSSVKRRHLREARRRHQPVQAPQPRTIAILFCDDSTLIFAQRMREVLLLADPDCPIEMIWFTDENALSYRQISQLLPEGPDKVLNGKGLEALARSKDIAAIVTSRVFGPLMTQLRKRVYRWSHPRPCIIGFLGGLDFSPHHGFARRSHCDGVYLFPHSAIPAYHEQTRHLEAGWQDVGFGHPSVLTPVPAPDDLDQRRDIFFFTQALSPLTKRGRQHILRMLIAIARANPDRRVLIKLRHLPSENREHLHLERYDYLSLVSGMGQDTLPDNLVLTDMRMEQALEMAAVGITCTSTAAVDVVRAGLPCMVYLDYVDAYRDPLVEPMERLFRDSNLITPLERVLELDHSTPDPEWVADMFCPRDLGQRVLDTITRFEERPFQVSCAAMP